MTDLYFPEVLDSSIVATMKRCPQLFKKVYIDQWKSKEPSIHLGAGGAFAAGLEATRKAFFIDGLESEDSLVEGLKALLIAYGDLQCPEDSGKSWENTAGALVAYIDNYPLNHETGYPIELPGGKRAIEFNYTSPLEIAHPVTGQPILYTGRSDAIVHFASDNFICDEKTTSQLGFTWPRKWGLRAQFTGYCWLARSNGMRVAGVLTRGIAIRKTGFDFAEAITYRPDWAIDRWYNELHEWIQQAICWAKSGHFRYNLDDSCTDYGGCGFTTACESENELPWLETFFERRIWDPITREERKI